MIHNAQRMDNYYSQVDDILCCGCGLLFVLKLNAVYSKKSDTWDHNRLSELLCSAPFAKCYNFNNKHSNHSTVCEWKQFAQRTNSLSFSLWKLIRITEYIFLEREKENKWNHDAHRIIIDGGHLYFCLCNLIIITHLFIHYYSDRYCWMHWCS